MPEMLPALSIAQPWAHFVTHGLKKIEGRNWYPYWQGRRFQQGDRWRLLIHAPLKKDMWSTPGGRFILSDFTKINGRPLPELVPPDYPFPRDTSVHYQRDHAGTGGIVGMVTLKIGRASCRERV